MLPGTSDEEVLISTHVCHPSMANDNLSGIVVATFLARHLAQRDRRYSYRFLFVPATIGPIAWLAQNEARTGRIRHGLVLAGLGDAGPPIYRKSRQGSAEVDRAAEHVLRHMDETTEIFDFEPFGYSKRSAPHRVQRRPAHRPFPSNPRPRA